MPVNPKPDHPETTREIPATATHLKLYESAGVQFHLGFCNGCSAVHWGLVASSKRPPERFCSRASTDQGNGGTGQEVHIKCGALPMKSSVFALSAPANLKDEPGSGYEPARLASDTSLQILTFEPAVVLEGHSEPAIQNRKFQLIFFDVKFPSPLAEGPRQLSLTFAVADRCRRATIGDIISVHELKQLTAADHDVELRMFGAVTSLVTVDVPLMILSHRTV